MVNFVFFCKKKKNTHIHKYTGFVLDIKEVQNNPSIVGAATSPQTVFMNVESDTNMMNTTVTTNRMEFQGKLYSDRLSHASTRLGPKVTENTQFSVML
jgi:hypothetical protein